MKRIWLQFIFNLLLMVVAGGVTGSFFNDAEGGQDNSFAADRLDAVLESGEWSLPHCSFDEPAVKRLDVKNEADTDAEFEYSIESAILGGDAMFCDGLLLFASRNGAEVYDGALRDFFQSSLHSLAGGDMWEFELSVDGALANAEVHNKVCMFDFVVRASLDGFLYGEAFYDEEIDPNAITGHAPPGGGGGDVNIDIDNDATVINDVSSSSNTGGNVAGGSTGGDGGDSGDVEGSGSSGEGGDGGEAGAGGTVVTGDSTSSATVVNEVNTNTIDIDSDSCGTCAGERETTREQDTSRPAREGENQTDENENEPQPAEEPEPPLEETS